jgi:hypothetical protein
MTKTLTEKWKDGELPEGFYYVLLRDSNDIYIRYLDQTKYSVYFECFKEVLAPVPSYYEYEELVSKTEELQKKLGIATKALEYYADENNYCQWALDEDGDLPEEAREALKEMEGVK